MSKPSPASESLFDSTPDWATVFAAAVLGASIVFAGGRVHPTAGHSTSDHARTSTVVAEGVAPCRELQPASAAMAQVFVPQVETAVPAAVEAPSKAPVVVETKPVTFPAAPAHARTARRASVIVAKPRAALAVNPATALDDPGF